MAEDITQQKWHLPEKHRVDEGRNPQLLEKSLEQQRVLARHTASPFSRLSPREQARARAPLQLDDLTAQLEALERDIPTLEGQVRDNAEKRRLIVLSLLAEANAALGRFEESVRIEPNAEKRQEYQNLLDAISRDDTEDCQCTDPQGAFPVSRKARTEIIFDADSGRDRHVIKCNKCGLMNAVLEIPKDVQRTISAEAAAHQAFGHLSPQEAMRREKESGRTHAVVTK